MKRRCASVAVAWFCTALIAASVGVAQQRAQEPAAAPAADTLAAEKAAHRARLQELAASFRVLAVPGKPESQVELASEPVLRYSDSTRQTLESALWIFGRQGRPTAILAIEYYPNRRAGPSWLYEVASLSTERIAAERGDNLAWSAKQPGLVLKPLADAPPPAARPAQRLAQMKTLRASFTAYEHAVIEGRVELRPLASPLYRYSESERGITDGAIFSFANGTNPEVLLVLEAHEAGGNTGWQFGIVQLTGGAIVVQQDGKDIFERGEADPPAVRDSYVNGWIPAKD